MSHSGQVVIINATTGGVAAADMVLMSYSLDDATQALTLTVGDGTNSVDIGPIDFTAAINTATQGQLGVTSATVNDATQTVTITMNDGSTAGVDLTAAINTALTAYLAANSDVSLTNNGDNTLTFSNGVDADVTFVSSVGTLTDNGDGTITFANGINPDVTVTLGGPTATDTNILTDSLASDADQVQDFAGFKQTWNGLSLFDINIVDGMAILTVSSNFFSGEGELHIGTEHARVTANGSNPGQGRGTAEGTAGHGGVKFEAGGNEASFHASMGGVGGALGVPQTHMVSQAVNAAIATTGQVATLMNEATGEVEFQNPAAPVVSDMTRLAAFSTPIYRSSAGDLITRVIESNNTANVQPDGNVSSHYRCGGAGTTNTTMANPVGYGVYDRLLIEIRNAASVPTTFDFGSDYFYNDGVAIGSITLQPNEVFSGEFQYSQQNGTPTPWRAISINRKPASGGLTIADMASRQTFDRELYVSSSGEVKSRVIMNVGINGNIVPNGANSSHYRLQRNVLSGASNIEASTGYLVYSELTFDLVANGAGSASFAFNAEYVYADGTPVGTLSVPIGAATQVNFVRDTFGWRVLSISRGSNGAAGAASNGGTAIFTSTVVNSDKPTQAEFNGVFQAGISTIDLDLSQFTSSGVIEIRPTMNGAFNVVGAWSAGAYNDEFGSGNLNGATYLAGQVYQMRVLFSGTDPYVFIVKLT